MSGFMARGTYMILHIFHRRNSGSVGIYGKRGIKTNVTFSEGSPPELCVIVPIDKRGWACENISIFCVSIFYFLYILSFVYFVICICISYFVDKRGWACEKISSFHLFFVNFLFCIFRILYIFFVLGPMPPSGRRT